MMLEFDMSNMGKMRHFLGVEVVQSTHRIFIFQRRYAHEVLSKFGMENNNQLKNPLFLVQYYQKMRLAKKLTPVYSSNLLKVYYI